MNTSISLNGSVPYLKKIITVLALLWSFADACLYPKCAIGNAYVPKLKGNFFATENFFYTSEVFSLIQFSVLDIFYCISIFILLYHLSHLLITVILIL
jgi:hypothetical protein